MSAVNHLGNRRIGILLCDTDNPFWQAKIEQYRNLADSFGFDVEFRAARNANDTEEQRSELLRIAEENYDAVIINPLTADNLLSVLSELPFPAFDVGPKCDPKKTTGLRNYFPVFVADFEEQGFLAGEALTSALEPTDEAWALIIGGFFDARHSSLRCRGAFKAFRKVFTQEHIITIYANFNRYDARKAVKALVPKLDIRAVFCANDLMALGASDVLAESASGSSVPVGGVDAIPEALDALKDGRLFCTVSLSHEEVVSGVYRAVTNWFDGILPSGNPIAHSALIRRP